jgi:hypothetical protein
MNSTFSWWGAGLKPDSEKMVFSPERWFSDGVRGTPDLLPATRVKS